MSWMDWFKARGGAVRPVDPNEDPNVARQRENLATVSATLTLGLVVGLLVALWYAGWECAVVWAWALACLMTGGLVGFLFGIPRVVQGERRPAPPPAPAAAGAAPAAAGAAEEYDQRV